MLIRFNPSIMNKSNPVQKSNDATFGGRSIPKNSMEAFNLRDEVTFKTFNLNEENLAFLKDAYAKSDKIVRKFLENIAEKWGKNPDEVFAGIK